MFKRVFKSIAGVFVSERKGSDGKAGAGGSAASRYRELRDAGSNLPANSTPEKLCGITKSMKREEIDKHLTELYRRHNRAASSLDPKLREEAEMMLDAIVELRMKYSSQSEAKG